MVSDLGRTLGSLEVYVGDLAVPKMSDFGARSPGHEGAGVVVKVGANVKTFKVGDRAGVKPIWDVCHNCELCYGDKETYCDGMLFTGLHNNGMYPNSYANGTRV